MAMVTADAAFQGFGQVTLARDGRFVSTPACALHRSHAAHPCRVRFMVANC